jgi:hypothetical protein
VIPAGLTAYGPFFALAVVSGDGWLPFPGDVDDRVKQTQTELERRVGHPVEGRVAASLAHLSLVARLVSPALAIAGTEGLIPDLRPENLRWKPQLGGPAPLGVVDDTLHQPERLPELVLTTVDAVGSALVRSPRIRTGNVASAIATVGRLCPPAEPFARRILGAYEPTSPVPQGFRRTSCCLYYRVDPRAGLCADCVLRRP